MKKHPGYFALVCIVLGIVAADLVRPPVWTVLGLALLSALTGWTLLIRRRSPAAAEAFGVTLMSLAALGFAFHVYAFGPDDITQVEPYGHRSRIVGTIDDWPILRTDRTDLTVALDTVAGETVLPVRGRILVRLNDTTTAVERGDRVEFYGAIYPVPPHQAGGFDYARYLRLHGIGGIVYLRSLQDLRVAPARKYRLTRLVDRLRAAITSAFHENLDPVSAALAAGFLIGETRNIPPMVYRQFRNSGTLHLLAVSGSNVALIVLFALVLLRPFHLGRRWRAIVLLGVIGLFTMLSYEQPSVVRAAVMASLVIVGRLVERRLDLNHIVAVAAVIILLAAPAQLFDIGFQLSFVTAWGLIFATPKVYALFPNHHNSRWFRFLALPLSVAVIAQLFSTPLIALYFQRIPLISPLANLVIVPLVSVAVIGVLAVLAAAFLFPPLAHAAGAMLDRLMDLIMRLLEFFTHTRMPLIDTGTIPAVVTTGIYVCLVLVFASFESRRSRRMLVFAATGLVFFALVPAVRLTLAPRPMVEIRVATVPGGIAAVVSQSASRTTDLILTGLTAKPYPLHERVLAPLLDRAGTAHVRSVILLSADFNALDHILRLTDSLAVERLYLHRRLRASYADFVRFGGLEPTTPVVFFGGTAADSTGFTGFRLDNAGVRLQCGGGQLVVADPRAQPPAPDLQPAVLIDPRRPLRLADGLSRLGSGRYSWVVCAKIAQGDNRGQVIPPRLIELSRVGEIRLQFDRDLQNSMQVIGLD